ncbi:hypothetical protein D4764_21G0002920, partial [Takifugu flavidus]
ERVRGRRDIRCHRSDSSQSKAASPRQPAPGSLPGVYRRPAYTGVQPPIRSRMWCGCGKQRVPSVWYSSAAHTGI